MTRELDALIHILTLIIFHIRIRIRIRIIVPINQRCKFLTAIPPDLFLY
jgi:hypothetical protein